MKAVVGTFNQEKALVGAFSVIVQPVLEPMDRFAALVISVPIYLLNQTRPLQNINGRFRSVSVGQTAASRLLWLQLN